MLTCSCLGTVFPSRQVIFLLPFLPTQRTHLVCPRGDNPDPITSCVACFRLVFAIVAMRIFQKWPQYLPSHLLSLQYGLGAAPVEWWVLPPLEASWSFMGLLTLDNENQGSSVFSWVLMLGIQLPGHERAQTSSHGEIQWKNHVRCSGQQSRPSQACRDASMTQAPSCRVTPSLKVTPNLQVFLAEAPNISEQRQTTPLYLVRVPECGR